MSLHPSVLHLTLLGFAVWTLGVLAFTVGIHRWSRILTGKAAIHEFPAHAPAGPDWYRRATRAHLNCVENLPVYGAIVVTATSIGAAGRALDALAVTVLAARIVQTVVHIAFTESRRSVSVRFSFFSIQLVAMGAMAVVLLTHSR